MTAHRPHDIAVFGATGFVGRLVAEYLAAHLPPGVSVALAGRAEDRLAAVRHEIGGRARDWPIITADLSDPASLARLAQSTRVVITTAGPYRPQGLSLVEACVKARTDYADLTGEVLFMRASVDQHHDDARRAGVRIVHACGFDSIPSDLGVLLLHDAASADRTGRLRDTTLVVRSLRGGVSGGTVASMKRQLDEVRSDPRSRRIVGDPYALSPSRSREPDLGDESELLRPVRDPELGMWIGPFIMAGANTRVVRRSNALQGWAYGRRFRYREVVGFGDRPAAPLAAAATSGALAGFALAMRFAPARQVLDRVLPAPGTGPGPKTRRGGHFRVDIHTRTSRGARYVAQVSAQGDPGYAATSVMLGEVALCLAQDRDGLPGRAGVLTPATAMGGALVNRLRAAGQTLTVRRQGR